jgi:hypothetical protein
VDPRDLPEKCFISHSYSDEIALRDLLQSLPSHVEPFIFPPINATPDQTVSNELVSAILSCPGLIYLGGWPSSKSFWVTFERDYALRAGKQVYEFYGGKSPFRRDTAIPPKLAVFPSFSRTDSDVVDRVLTFMRNDRFFELASNDSFLPGANIMETTRSRVADIVRAGGYVIAFWSSNAENSEYVRMELEQAFDYQLTILREQHRKHQKAKRPQDRLPWERRILFAGLDETPLPLVGPLGEYLREMNNYNQGDAWNALVPVRLTDAEGQLDLHRVDDLIVRTYWLIYRQYGLSDTR